MSGGCGGRRAKVEEVEQTVRATVALGLRPARVSELLDSLHIEHSAFDPQDKSILAIVRDTSRSAITRGSVQIKFMFGPDTTLVDQQYKEVFTGP